MKFYYTPIIGIFISSCAIVPKDASPIWEISNRFAVEMFNDCNSVEHSIGLGGCMFRQGKVNGNITFPGYYDGHISMISSNCKNVQMSTSGTENNVVKLQEIYTATNSLSCSFQVNQTLQHKDVIIDNGMIGRFFIKIIPDTTYYSPLKFSIGKEDFTGVGWFQKKTDTIEFGRQFADPDIASNDAVLTINPTGNKGTLTIMCDEEVVKIQEYTSKPFQVELKSDTSCDYELFATNSDISKLDLGTYLHEVSFYTMDITPPIVTSNKKYVTFEFKDLDASGKARVVVGVKIDTDKPCVGRSKCSTLNNRDLYTVRAITPSGRYFWGKWRNSTKTWLQIK